MSKKEEPRLVDRYKDIVECNLCRKWMTLDQYDNHYDKCLDLTYLIRIAKQQGKEIPREDLENAKPELIERLMNKYKPKENNYEL